MQIYNESFAISSISVLNVVKYVMNSNRELEVNIYDELESDNKITEIVTPDNQNKLDGNILRVVRELHEIARDRNNIQFTLVVDVKNEPAIVGREIIRVNRASRELLTRA